MQPSPGSRFFHQAPAGKLSQITAYYMRRNEACEQNSNADRERAAANAKKLVEVALEKIGAVGEISGESFAKLSLRVWFELRYPGYGRGC